MLASGMGPGLRKGRGLCGFNQFIWPRLNTFVIKGSPESGCKTEKNNCSNNNVVQNRDQLICWSWINEDLGLLQRSLHFLIKMENTWNSVYTLFRMVSGIKLAMIHSETAKI